MDDQATRPRALTLRERIRIAQTLEAHGLGHIRLPAITSGPTCHGYANGCTCPTCTTNAAHDNQPPAPTALHQPWQPRPARHQHAA